MRVPGALKAVTVTDCCAVIVGAYGRSAAPRAQSWVGVAVGLGDGLGVAAWTLDASDSSASDESVRTETGHLP